MKDILDEEKAPLLQFTNGEPSNNEVGEVSKKTNEDNEGTTNEGISIKIGIPKGERVEKTSEEPSRDEDIKRVNGKENETIGHKTIISEDTSNVISNNPTTTTTTTTSTVGFQVMNENGDEEENIIWHDPGLYIFIHDKKNVKRSVEQSQVGVDLSLYG